MMWLDKTATPRIGHCVVLMAIHVFLCLGVARDLGRESGDLGAINICECS